MCWFDSVEFREVNMDQIGVVVDLFFFGIVKIIDTIHTIHGAVDIFDAIGDLLWKLYCHRHDV